MHNLKLNCCPSQGRWSTFILAHPCTTTFFMFLFFCLKNLSRSFSSCSLHMLARIMIMMANKKKRKKWERKVQGQFCDQFNSPHLLLDFSFMILNLEIILRSKMWIKSQFATIKPDFSLNFFKTRQAMRKNLEILFNQDGSISAHTFVYFFNKEFRERIISLFYGLRIDQEKRRRRGN